MSGIYSWGQVASPLISNIPVYIFKPSITCLKKASERKGSVKVIQGDCGLVKPRGCNESHHRLLIVTGAFE
jgi:hypothetical protein